MTGTQIQSALNAISSLQLSVADLNTRMASLSSQIQAQGGTVTPQGQAITTITNTITSEASKPFAVVDGQVFLSTADVLKAAIDPARFEVKLRENSQGQYYAAGVGVGVQPGKPKVIIAQELLDEIQKQINESSLGKNLSSLENRVAAAELARVTQKGLDEAAAARLCQRLDALQAQIDLLQGKVHSRG